MSDRDVAVSVRGLSKSYTITHSAPKHTTMAEALVNTFRRPSVRPDRETFWALRDVEFDVPKGGVVGVVGRNGAGKSTLLKILSRIAEPTTGRIDIYGRVGSLLEVGTGFHPELTGRENIAMNGAILGMSRREIARQFDAIVEFAEVAQFLDTPVKRYSSGMYVRLAFAVAAHLNPEILIVDEVLAVGDAEFQKKCLGKMKDVAHEGGRTVLFVSHNMAAVRQLCDTALLLRSGRLACHAETDEVVAEYMRAQHGAGFRPVSGKHGLELAHASLDDAAGQPSGTAIFDQAYSFRVVVRAHERPVVGAIIIEVMNDLGILVSSMCSIEEGMPFTRFEDEVEITFDIPHLRLYPGKYVTNVIVCDVTEHWIKAEAAVTFEVEPAVVRGAMWAYQRFHGLVRIADGARQRAVGVSPLRA